MRYLGFLLWTCLLLNSCFPLQSTMRMEDFEKITKAYDHAIRWGDFNVLHRFMRMPENVTSLPRSGKIDRVKVSYYEPQRNVVQESTTRILRIIDIRYYRVDNPREKTLQDKQLWEFDESTNRWFLISGLPAFE